MFPTYNSLAEVPVSIPLWPFGTSTFRVAGPVVPVRNLVSILFGLSVLQLTLPEDSLVMTEKFQSLIGLSLFQHDDLPYQLGTALQKFQFLLGLSLLQQDVRAARELLRPPVSIPLWPF